ncbi:hypothetical protein LRC484719_22390 [Mycobacterium riyadhense]|uniref:LLM class F420-dependent oxidoreductase n=1 Tax=Mycobacterium riyadhense TaxID=486698 RepID=A0A653EKU2_9MYCO|nr:hypothetical protein [Mycobacterium riyadhense]VTO97967.1 hypothetical protein BIN_B_02337 [Mycobacterium riyadhense]
MSGIEVVLPFWLDRPDLEAIDGAQAASDAGFDTVWIGEMAKDPGGRATLHALVQEI